MTIEVNESQNMSQQTTSFSQRNAYSARANCRQMSELKSNLIRHQVVNRADLMKNYRQPVKKSQLAETNPFHNISLMQSSLRRSMRQDTVDDSDVKSEMRTLVKATSGSGVLKTARVASAHQATAGWTTSRTHLQTISSTGSAVKIPAT
jgi:hypothetical protein